MSAPSPHPLRGRGTQQQLHQQQQPEVCIPVSASATGSSSSVVVEDCRDYVRTGRCKYGNSCKYNHPPNVQSGGGMKAPLNPSEPLFPIRPNEPICQYYAKHGTCKFGQACKFHHPPSLHLSQPLQTFMANGRIPSDPVFMIGLNSHHSALVSSESEGSTHPHHLLCNSIGTDLTSGSTILQFLPQRPGEPDCIYFLKNGRCKYGATCRYHHPMDYQPRRALDELPRRHTSPSLVATTQPQSRISHSSMHTHTRPLSDQFRLQNSTSYATMSHLIPQATYVTTTPVTALDTTPSSYAYPVTTNTTTTTTLDHNSASSSSIASSYETARSSIMDLHFQNSNNQAAADSSVLWNRARRNGSGSSLNAYLDNIGTNVGSSSTPGRKTSSSMLPHGNTKSLLLHSSSSDGNISHQQQRNRSLSYGSTSDTSYYDASSTSLSRTTSVGSWRNNSETTLDSVSRGGGRSLPPLQYNSSSSSFLKQDIEYERPSPQQRSRPTRMTTMLPPPPPPSSYGTRMRQSPRGILRENDNDQGLNMMTSALLNMLDAPEERVYGDEDDDEDIAEYRYYYEDVHQSNPTRGSHLHHFPFQEETLDPSFFEHLSISDHQSTIPHPTIVDGNDSSWSPASLRPISNDLNYIKAVGEADPFQLVQQHHHATTNTSHTAASGGDVGLFLS